MDTFDLLCSLTEGVKNKVGIDSDEEIEFKTNSRLTNGSKLVKSVEKEIVEDLKQEEKVINDKVFETSSENSNTEKNNIGHKLQDSPSNTRGGKNKIQRNGNPFKRGPRKKKEIVVEPVIEESIIEDSVKEVDNVESSLYDEIIEDIIAESVLEEVIVDSSEEIIEDTFVDSSFEEDYVEELEGIEDVLEGEEVEELSISDFVEDLDDEDFNFLDDPLLKTLDNESDIYLGLSEDKEDLDDSLEEVVSVDIGVVEEVKTEEDAPIDTEDVKTDENIPFEVEEDIILPNVEIPKEEVSIKEESVEVIQEEINNVEIIQEETVESDKIQEEPIKEDIPESLEDYKFRGCNYYKGMDIEEYLRLNPDYRDAEYVEHFYSKDYLNKMLMSGMILIKKGKYRL